MATSELLRMAEVSSGYGASQVLFGVTLEIRAGEVVTLLGRNGMGKTTTVRTLFRELPLVGGGITLRGERLDDKPAWRAARAGLGLVPEGRQVFANLTVRENLVATAANRLGHPDPWTEERVYAFFPQLRERTGHYGGQLSGGEQQMLAIGRALMTNPDLLVLDEATEGLAPLVRRQIWESLLALKEAGLSILLIDKRFDDLLAIGDRHYVLEKGRIVWSGDSASLAAAEEVKHRHLGV